MIKGLRFIIVLLTTQLAFIGLSINKQSQWIKTMYNQQLLEKEQAIVLTKKQNLSNQLSSLHNKTQVKQYALSQGLFPLSLSQIKKIIL